MATTDHIRTLVEPLIDERGFVLYDIEQQGPVVRVTVAPGDDGVAPSIDDLTAITRQLSRTLDEIDPIEGRYTLEVSSPGLERPLRTPAHFAGAVGETVMIKTRRSDDGARRLRGELLTVADDHVVLGLHDAEPGTEATVAYDEIEKARTIFEWGPTTKPGGGLPTSPARTRRST